MINDSQFWRIFDYAEEVESSKYHLGTNNCTTFAVWAAKIAGLNIGGDGSIPIFQSSMFGISISWKSGKNPASLGQDIMEGKYYSIDTIYKSIVEPN